MSTEPKTPWTNVSCTHLLSPSFWKIMFGRRLWQCRQHLQLLQVQHRSPLQRTLQFMQRLMLCLMHTEALLLSTPFVTGIICKRHYTHITWQLITIIITPGLHRPNNRVDNWHGVDFEQTATTLSTMQLSRTLTLPQYVCTSLVLVAEIYLWSTVLFYERG